VNNIKHKISERSGSITTTSCNS